MITFNDFEKVDIRIGKVIKVEDAQNLRISAYKMTIDFGEILGQKVSIGQYTKGYTKEELQDRLVLCVINFEPKKIGEYTSEVLTCGFDGEGGDVVLAVPDKDVPLGTRMF